MSTEPSEFYLDFQVKATATSTNSSNNVNSTDTNNPVTDYWAAFDQRLQHILTYLCQRDPKLIWLFASIEVDWPSIIKPPYVALIGAIAGQKISFVAARKIRRNLYQLLGTAFSPSDIDALSDSSLSQLGLSTNNLNTIRKLNLYLRAQKLTLTSAEEIHQLIKVPGIGPWTVNTTLLTSMLDWSSFPPSDAFILKRLAKLYALPQVPKASQIEVLCQRWAPYQGVVAWYLWRWFDLTQGPS